MLVLGLITLCLARQVKFVLFVLIDLFFYAFFFPFFYKNPCNLFPCLLFFQENRKLFGSVHLNFCFHIFALTIRIFAFTCAGAGNNWAKGYYTEGAELIDQVTRCYYSEEQS